jgi:uncharacterized protein YjbJ (UPF0337 family)
MKMNQTRLPQSMYGAIGSVMLLAIVMTGCGTTTSEGLNYAETLAIYNDEVRLLDRLTEQRDQLQQELDSPPTAIYLDAASQLLGDTTGLSKQLSGTLQDLAGKVNLPDEEEAQQRQDELIGSVTDQIELAKASQQEKAQQWQTRKKEIAAKIAELDQKIVEQQQKVDRAMADKDAADAAR